ncbi:right-handed parallel beta-helix repeat-containing protein [Microbacterium sp. NPDC019599]|uniref:right-handed parallel beta-helix repeat-containing protein n=1 Tax=Microbacterium sp. NPDC019599 TaxID=3154690 RepID=UPI0033E85222
MTVMQRLLGAVLLVVAVIATALVVAIVVGPGFGGPFTRISVTLDESAGRPYAGDPETEPSLVQAERERVAFVVGLSASLPWRNGVQGPFVVPTAPAPTLVLPARPEPYTIDDLAALAPDAFAAQPDGSFLVSESIVVLPDAALDLSGAGAVNLLSTPDVFVSIVAAGGALTLAGDAAAPVAVSSFDPATSAPDTTTSDGRAYVRVVGGAVDIRSAAFTDLGFWSGETGGLAFTGATKPAKEPALAQPDGTGAGQAWILTPDDLAWAVEDRNVGDAPVTGALSGVTTSGNAFGIFVSGAEGFAIEDSRVERSLVDGIVLHRGVTDATITSTSSIGNGADGIVVDRSSSSVILDGITSSGNGRNGVSIDGRPLAEGPNASGAPATEGGHVTIVRSRVSANERYGIEVNGGREIGIARTDVAGGIVGVVVADDATDVNVSESTFANQERQSISLRSGATDAVIRGNRISSVATGIHVYDATARIEDNDFLAISQHAVTLSGHAIGARIVDNTIAGHGTTAIHDGAVGGYAARNDTEGWRTPVTPRSSIETLAQPLTLVWIALGVLVVATAFIRRRGGRTNPYPEHLPLTQLSQGIVSRDAVGKAKP